MNKMILSKKNWTFSSLLFTPLFALAFSSSSDVIGNLPLQQNLNISMYSPVNLNHQPEVLISRDVYLISFNPQKRLLNWAAWKIESSDLGSVGRSNNFQVDSDLQTYLGKSNMQAVQPDDYVGSCFDRGHQVPSADRDTSTAVNQLTFLMSNMIPQTAYLNRVVWEHLEHYTRELVRTQNKKVYIIAGPIYDEDFGSIGKNNDIPVPSKDFKIVISINQNENIEDPNVKPDVVAVVMPNIMKNGKKPNEDKTELCDESKNLSIGTGISQTMNYDDWKAYQVDVSEVEKLSGFKIENLK
jgi:endonuclease G, mitochondrial